MNHLNEEILDSYLDAAIDQATRIEVDTHLATCPECAARLEALRSVFAVLEELPEVSLARDLSVGVVMAIKAKPVARPVLAPAIRVVFVAQALLALVVVAVALPLGMQFVETLSDFELPVATLTSLIPSFQVGFSLPSPEALIPSNVFALPTQLPVAEFSTLAMTIGLAAVTVLWFVGNGLLLRPTRKVR